MQLRYKYLLFSIGVTVAWVTVGFLLAPTVHGKLGNSFGLTIFNILTRQVTMVIGIILLFLRMIRIIKPTHFAYILLGILNAGVGVLAIILYFTDLANRQWLNISLYNLLLALILISDSLWYKQEPPTA
ncbi:hypothetical protein D3H65_28255 [Paraflavitalea soli]|uniref:Uncharacterized protein n=1 Tax=Paraflavitalea soli TaxID=2315862 RepID=A0A3B7MUR1_9BACT|nr:hypothetical protein D3H65_28255 [Paraflavitalea soli]